MNWRIAKSQALTVLVTSKLIVAYSVHTLVFWDLRLKWTRSWANTQRCQSQAICSPSCLLARSLWTTPAENKVNFSWLVFPSFLVLIHPLSQSTHLYFKMLRVYESSLNRRMKANQYVHCTLLTEITVVYFW